MKKLTLIISLLTMTSALRAQETGSAQHEPSKPDYSRNTLITLFANDPQREKVDPRVKWSVGAVDFKAAGMRWRIGYLPFLMPLSGSQPWINGQRWPDPFLLTGTTFASTPRTWKQRRNMTAEMRRIDRKTRERQKVKVNTP